MYYYLIRHSESNSIVIWSEAWKFSMELNFKFEKGLNESRCSIVDEKERRHVKCGLWIIKSFQDFEVWTKTRTKTRTKNDLYNRNWTKTKMIAVKKIEIELKLNWFHGELNKN